MRTSRPSGERAIWSTVCGSRTDMASSCRSAGGRGLDGLQPAEEGLDLLRTVDLRLRMRGVAPEPLDAPLGLAEERVQDAHVADDGTVSGVLTALVDGGTDERNGGPAVQPGP